MIHVLLYRDADRTSCGRMHKQHAPGCSWHRPHGGTYIHVHAAMGVLKSGGARGASPTRTMVNHDTVTKRVSARQDWVCFAGVTGFMVSASTLLSAAAQGQRCTPLLAAGVVICCWVLHATHSCTSAVPWSTGCCLSFCRASSNLVNLDRNVSSSRCGLTRHPMCSPSLVT